MTEIDEKVQRLATFAETQRLAGVLISKQPEFAWLTAGRSNRIDGSSESGAGSILITADARRYVIANNIEMPRLQDETLRGLQFTPVEYPWPNDHADPASAVKRAQQIVKGDIGADVAAPGTTDVSGLLPSLQTPLTSDEIARYRTLGAEVAQTVEHLCRGLTPGASEMEVANEVNGAIALIGGRPVVTLVAADDRIAAFRHPVPTDKPWTHSILIGLCVERHGLVVALSRIVSARAQELREITQAAATVFGMLLDATKPGVTGAQLFTAARNAYRHVGHEREERKHHQGGAIGYRSRDWIAHPASAAVVQRGQAFAWNPSITGTKVEDTALLVDDQIEVITSMSDWPTIELAVGDRPVRAAGVLEI